MGGNETLVHVIGIGGNGRVARSTYTAVTLLGPRSGFGWLCGFTFRTFPSAANDPSMVLYAQREAYNWGMLENHAEAGVLHISQ